MVDLWKFFRVEHNVYVHYWLLDELVERFDFVLVRKGTVYVKNYGYEYCVEVRKPQKKVIE